MINRTTFHIKTDNFQVKPPYRLKPNIVNAHHQHFMRRSIENLVNHLEWMYVDGIIPRECIELINQDQLDIYRQIYCTLRPDVVKIGWEHITQE